MTIERGKDILAHAREFHETLVDFYHKLGETISQERVRLLLSYLEQHEKHLQKVLEDYSQEEAPRLLETWYKHSTCRDLKNKLSEIAHAESVDTEQLVKTAVQLDDCVIDFYREMMTKTENPDLEKIFENLLQLEEREKKKVVKNALRLSDL